MLDRHVDGFLAHALQVAGDSKKADIAEEAALTLKFVCEEKEIFAVQLHRCMPLLLRLFQLRLGAVVEIFYAPDDVNVSVATYQAEILLKAFYGLQLSCPAFRTLCAPLFSAKLIAELHAESALVASLWKLLLRFVMSPKCPVPNVGPAGIAFCFILLSVGPPAQSLQHILSFFFPQLLAPDAPAVTFEPSTLLLLEAPFRDFVSKLSPLPLTMLLRGLVIAGPSLMAIPVNGRGILLIEAFFPLFSTLCENTTACEQSTRVAVFQSLSIVCHKMREIFEGPPPPTEGEAKPPPPITETLCISPEGLYALLGRLLRLALSFWEESNDGVVIQVKSQFANLCDMHTLALKRGVDSAQHVHFTEELFARVAKLRWVQKAKVREAPCF